MGKSEMGGHGGFHELPLVGFTALAVAGGGVGLAHLLFVLLGWAPLVPAAAPAGLAAALLLGGMLLSGGHLGRPLRAPRALTRLGRSALSNEIAVVGGTFAAATLCALIPAGSGLQPWLALGFMAGGGLTLLSLGRVYDLKGQLAWGGSAVLHPLVLGSAVGALLHSLAGGTGEIAPVQSLVIPLLFVDAGIVWSSARRRARSLAGGAPVHPRFWKRRRALILARLVVALPLPIFALVADRPAAALLLLALGLLLDRVAFYGLAVRSTTSSELARVEEILKMPGRSRQGQ